ncbi:Phosphorylated carbohydrates phosphatase TM_1254 [Delftia tsuruhatensis]|uniref:HAD family hydrolase n=1 Tax=Delftia tsuruhatensis TaxID=180282 RepID=UPI001E782546|nr:HAD family hydrolase [Delftia tsuruhatensis]CAB5692742.1 Phosphorylated carbohydrates phosphatase TM_1254 [Delftia tsuruhatensis]CAC9687649.1 Phosphorylated carbohydrates phosphatase TM_1254 [Delftia tsuruhatensis]
MATPALLWDFDGTLVDTGALWRQSEYDFLAARGLPWNDAASERLLGGNLELAAEVMAEVTGARFTVEELRQGMGEAVRAALSRQVPWMPGVPRLLRAQGLHGLRCALVTSSYASIVRTALDPLPHCPFQAMVTREDVSLPKPAPQPYLLALERLGVPAAHALAIEDSPSGVASARAAGCHVLAVGPQLQALARRHVGDRRLAQVDSLAHMGLDDLLALFPGLPRLPPRPAG